MTEFEQYLEMEISKCDLRISEAEMKRDSDMHRVYRAMKEKLKEVLEKYQSTEKKDGP